MNLGIGHNMCKCNICDKEIQGDEIQWNAAGQFFEPCGTCLEIAMDAAYSDGFQYEEDIVTVLDTSFDGDASDIVYSPMNENDYD